jgi:hypothetical protein
MMAIGHDSDTPPAAAPGDADECWGWHVRAGCRPRRRRRPGRRRWRRWTSTDALDAGFDPAQTLPADLDEMRPPAGVFLVATLRPKTKAPGVGLRYGSDPQTCPVRTLRAWLDAADIDEGPAFRHIDRQGRLFPDRIFGRAAAERVSEARSRARRGSDDQSGPCRNPRGRPCQRRTTGRSTLTDLRVRARGRRRLPRGIRCGRRSSRPPIPS